MPFTFQNLLGSIYKYQQLKFIEKRIEILKNELHRERKIATDLKSQVEEEHAVILSLERHSLYQVFSDLLNNDDQQLEEKRKEYLLATLEYNECVKVIELLEFELRVLETKLHDKDCLLQAIDRDLTELESNDQIAKSNELVQLKKISERLNEHVKLKIETKEAIEVAKEIQENYSAMIRLLNQEQEIANWGDLYAEIQERKLIKKSYIDKAQAHVYVIHKLLRIIINEIKDVKRFEAIYKRTSHNISGFNLDYYQFLISDWVSDKNLMATLTMTLSAHSTIVKLIRGLESVDDFVDKKIKKIKNEREEVILQIESEVNQK